MLRVSLMERVSNTCPQTVKSAKSAVKIPESARFKRVPPKTPIPPPKTCQRFLQTWQSLNHYPHRPPSPHCPPFLLSIFYFLSTRICNPSTLLFYFPNAFLKPLTPYLFITHLYFKFR